MSLFHRSPESRMHHRLLKRMRYAYLVAEDLGERRLVHDNLRLLARGAESCHDDPVLYRHWWGQPMPGTLETAGDLEASFWRQLGTVLEAMDKQGYYPDAFREHTKRLQDGTEALQELLQLELQLITRGAMSIDERTVERLRRVLPTINDAA